MTTCADIDDFLALRRFAMVGVSRDPKDFSRGLFRDLCARGYDVVPVNLFADEVEGHETFQCLQAIRPAVEGALLMTAPHTTEIVVRDCAEAGIRRVWMYRAGGQGAVSPEAIEFCRNNDIRVVEGYCPYMFLPATAFPHRAHGFLMKLVGRYPRKAA
jgi:predicted CoA-binding protein